MERCNIGDRTTPVLQHSITPLLHSSQGSNRRLQKSEIHHPIHIHLGLNKPSIKIPVLIFLDLLKIHLTLRLRDGVNNERIVLPRRIDCGFRRLLLSGSSGFRVAHRGGAEYAEKKSNEDIILNKPSANSASLW
jgi:hypothetical protein